MDGGTLRILPFRPAHPLIDCGWWASHEGRYLNRSELLDGSAGRFTCNHNLCDNHIGRKGRWHYVPRGSGGIRLARNVPGT